MICVHRSTTRSRSGCLVVCLVLTTLAAGAAPDPQERPNGALWAALDVGAGRISLESDADLDDDSVRAHLAFSLGWSVNDRWIVGAQAGGWTLSSANLGDPSEGEGVVELHATTRYYPMADKGLHLRAGAGYARYWSNSEDFSRRSNGFGYELGVGWDVFRGRGHWALSPHLEWHSARMGDVSFHAWTAGLGISWR